MTDHYGSPNSPALHVVERYRMIDGATAYRAMSQTAAQVGALLQDDFRTYAYDRRGRGESGDTPPYAVQREIEDVAALIDEAGAPAFVCGFSSGAVLALDAAAARLPITRLALFEPPFVVDDSRPPGPADYVQRLDAAVAAGRPGDAVELFMTGAVGMPAEAVAGLRQSPFWPALEAVAHTIAYDGRIMGSTMSGQPLPADLGYHSPKPRYEDQSAMDDCDILGGECYYDGSGLNAERVYERLLREGDQGVWLALEGYYEDVFEKRTDGGFGEVLHALSKAADTEA